MDSENKYRGFWIEFRAMASNEPSYFSKKRFMELTSFIIFIMAYITYMIVNMRTITPEGFVVASAPVMAIIGYVLNHIQKEKKNENKQI